MDAYFPEQRGLSFSSSIFLGIHYFFFEDVFSNFLILLLGVGSTLLSLVLASYYIYWQEIYLLQAMSGIHSRDGWF
jgi:hypothetical protein